MPKPAKGKGKGKGKVKEPTNSGGLTEVDKTFFDLTVAELNKRLQRFENENAELQEKTKQIESKLKTIDQERSEVINYNKRVLNDKTIEINELKGTLEELEKKHQKEIETNKNKIETQKEEYKRVHEQFTTKIKLQTGQLSALDEFKSQKEDLLVKIEIKKQAIAENELKHKRNMYETARKFSIGKDKLKKDMEMQLLDISSVFQNTTQSRIAATTHRAIRENIAVNNELDAVLETINRLHSENICMKDNNIFLKSKMALHTDEKIKAIERSGIQLNLISKLTVDHDNIAKNLEGFRNNRTKVVAVSRELDNLKRDKETFEQYVRTVEQNLHSSRCAKNSLQTELQYSNGTYIKHLSTLNECTLTIKAFLKETISKKQRARREIELLERILLLLDAVNEETPIRSSIDSIESLLETYTKGDLGFEPKLVVPRSIFPLRTHEEVQIGRSFQDFVAKYIPPSKKELKVKTEVEMEERVEEEEEEEEAEEEEEKEQEKDKHKLHKTVSGELSSIEDEEETLVFGKSPELTPLSISETETMFTESVHFISDHEEDKEEEEDLDEEEESVSDEQETEEFESQVEKEDTVNENTKSPE